MSTAPDGPVAGALTHPPLPPRRAARVGSWWARAWVRALEEASYSEADLRAGRLLARSGDVGAITVSRGEVVASVADRRAQPSGLGTVRLRLPEFSDDEVDAFVEVVAAEVGRVGALLAGDLPHALVEHADEAGAELLPDGPSFECSCTCEAWLDPCPHALAVLTQLAWLIETDPLLLVHLRGLTRDELVARLHARGRRPAGEGTVPDGADHRETEEATLDLAADAARRAALMLADLDGPETPRSAAR